VAVVSHRHARLSRAAFSPARQNAKASKNEAKSKWNSKSLEKQDLAFFEGRSWTSSDRVTGKSANCEPQYYGGGWALQLR